MPTPGGVAVGTLEGWHYVVMDQLPGRPLSEVWDSVPGPERECLCARLGAAVGRLHALPTERLSLPGPAWSVFRQQQRESCAERQRAHGLAEEWFAFGPGGCIQRRLLDLVRVILVAALGERSSGGYGILLHRAVRRGGHVEVIVRSTSPGRSCGVPDVLPQPVDLARLPRTSRSIRFREQKKVKQCR